MTSMEWMTRRSLASAAFGLVSMIATAAGAAPNEQYFPMIGWRTGPLATLGVNVAAGWIDYMDLLNKRDGGINGVKLTWEECETAYKVDRGVECYERLKKNGPTGASTFNPINTGVIYALLDRSATDRIPLVTIGSGRTDAADGRVFPYAFPLGTNYLSMNTVKIKFIGMREGGMDKLKGKKIVNLHMDSAGGKETLSILEAQAKKYGFEVTHISVAMPGSEQESAWLQIRQLNPDWVILREWGVAPAVALKTAQKVGFPVNRIVGVTWAGTEDDLIPAGDAAKGFYVVHPFPTGSDYPVIQEIKNWLYSAGNRGNLQDQSRMGLVFYNIGVTYGIVNTEAVRVAQKKFGKKPLTGEEVRWGLEHLDLDETRLKELGAWGLVQTIRSSCLDHEGGGAAKVYQWDGSKLVQITDWIEADKSLTRPRVEESAAKYAAEKGITPRECSKEE
jgi:branched-chain amino acid transport system substrate-binding protein